jgi:hypothetical protein
MATTTGTESDDGCLDGGWAVAAWTRAGDKEPGREPAVVAETGASDDGPKKSGKEENLWMRNPKN